MNLTKNLKLEIATLIFDKYKEYEDINDCDVYFAGNGKDYWSPQEVTADVVGLIGETANYIPFEDFAVGDNGCIKIDDGDE